MLQERLKNDILVFDGAMGTQLQDIPECLNITDPKLIQTIHLNYLNAGADFITTNTFGANPLKMAEAPYSYEEIINAFTQAKAIKNKPSLILANTVKGKGVSFMENQASWHHGVLDAVQYKQALMELGDL